MSARWSRGCGATTRPTTRAAAFSTDDEIRALWAIEGNFADMCKVLLLTGQRLAKVSAMRWSDIALDGTWSIPTEAREKGNAGDLVLPELALEYHQAPAALRLVAVRLARSHWRASPQLLRAAQRLAGRDRRPGLEPSRSCAGPLDRLMSRAGILPHIAERVLGHAIEGVEGVYDRHSYRDQKAHALAALASLIENILQPPSGKVVPMVAAR